MMDIHLGMDALAVVSTVIFVLAALIMGSIINEPVHSKKEIDSYEGDDLDPRSKYRGKFFMNLVNGAPTGLVIATSIFNFLFPIVNVVGQVNRLTIAILKDDLTLYFISIISAFIVLKNVSRLMKLKSGFEEVGEGLNGYFEKRDIQYYIVKQYLVYNFAIIFCWYFRGVGSSSVFAIVLFLVILTIDDWNMLSKYLEFIPASKIKKMDLVKMLLITIAIPILMMAEVFQKIGLSVLLDSNFYLIAVVTFIWTWGDLIRLSLKYYRLAESW